MKIYLLDSKIGNLTSRTWSLSEDTVHAYKSNILVDLTGAVGSLGGFCRVYEADIDYKQSSIFPHYFVENFVEDQFSNGFRECSVISEYDRDSVAVVSAQALKAKYKDGATQVFYSEDKQEAVVTFASGASVYYFNKHGAYKSSTTWGTFS